MQFGINKLYFALQIFQRPRSALALRARALLLVSKKFTRAYLFQIAREKKSCAYLYKLGHKITISQFGATVA